MLRGQKCQRGASDQFSLQVLVPWHRIGTPKCVEKSLTKNCKIRTCGLCWMWQCLWIQDTKEKHSLKILMLHKGEQEESRGEKAESNGEKCGKNAFGFSSVIPALEPGSSLRSPLLTFHSALLLLWPWWDIALDSTQSKRKIHFCFCYLLDFWSFALH